MPPVVPNPGLSAVKLAAALESNTLPAAELVWWSTQVVNVLVAFELLDEKSAPEPIATAVAARTATRPASVRLGWRRKTVRRDMQDPLMGTSDC